jgi:hypothetical protein
MKKISYKILIEIPNDKVGPEANPNKNELWNVVTDEEGNTFRVAKDLFYGFKITEFPTVNKMVYSMIGSVAKSDDFLKPFNTLSNELESSKTATKAFKDGVLIAGYIIGNSLLTLSEADDDSKVSISRSMRDSKNGTKISVDFKQENVPEEKKEYMHFTGSLYEVNIAYKMLKDNKWRRNLPEMSIYQVGTNEHEAIKLALGTALEFIQDRLDRGNDDDFKIENVSIKKIKDLEIPIYKEEGK